VLRLRFLEGIGGEGKWEKGEVGEERIWENLVLNCYRIDFLGSYFILMKGKSNKN